jgi:putative hemolysin
MKLSGSGKLFESGARVFLAISILFLIVGPVLAITNPAATYCQALGYQYQTEKADDGSESGYCKLQDGRSVDAWKFLLGQEAQDCSYCAKRGYPTEVVSDPKYCQNFMTDQCAACVLESGEMVEVTRLMNLSFGGDTCNDGVCGMLENAGNCPGDCPSGERDEYCDGQRDGKCDPDCEGADDPDCPEKGGPAADEGTKPAMMEPAVDIIESPGNTADLKAVSLEVGDTSFDLGGSVARLPVWFRIENAGSAPSGSFKLSIDVIDSSGKRTVVPFTVRGQENIWYPTFSGLAGLAQTEISGEVTLGQPSGPDLHGQAFKLVAKVDSCSGDEFMPGYCRVEESDETNNEVEKSIAL